MALMLVLWLKAWDLRFAPAEEAAYTASVQAALAWFVSVASLVSGCAFLVNLVVCYPRDKWQISFQDVRMFCMASWLSYFVISVVVCTLALLRSRWGLFTKWDWEAVALAEAVLAVFAALLANTWHGSLLFGKEPVGLWPVDPHACDTIISLGADAALTAVCLFAPIRSCVLWVLPLVVVTTYSFVQLVIGSPFPEAAPVNIFVMYMLAFFACYGAYRNEKIARMQWRVSQELGMKEQELYDSSSILAGMQDVARFLCDIVVTLSEDLRVVSMQGTRAHLFGSQIRTGTAFCGMLKEDDQTRFVKMVRDAAASHIPQCTQVTFVLDGEPIEANLLVVLICGSSLRYIVGISMDSREVLPPPVNTEPLPLLERSVECNHHAISVRSECTFSLSLTHAAEQPMTTVDMGVQTEAQNAVARPPVLPAKITPPPLNRTAVICGRSRRRPPGNMEHALDGDWQAVDVLSLNKWLHRLVILGPHVTDGEGGQSHLTLNAQGDVTLDCGVLTLQGETLLRIGRSGKSTSFTRAMIDTGSDSEDEPLFIRTGIFQDLPELENFIQANEQFIQSIEDAETRSEEKSNHEYDDVLFSLPGYVSLP